LFSLPSPKPGGQELRTFAGRGSGSKSSPPRDLAYWDLLDSLPWWFGITGAALLLALAFALEHVTDARWYALPRAARNEHGYSFRVVSRRVSRVAVAALIVAAVGIAATQVKAIVEDGVADWLTADATTFGELIAVTVLSLLFLALLMLPLWRVGGRVLDRVVELRLKRSLREANRQEP